MKYYHALPLHHGSAVKTQIQRHLVAFMCKFFFNVLPLQIHISLIFIIYNIPSLYIKQANHPIFFLGKKLSVKGENTI